MKTLKKVLLFLCIITLFFSCNNNEKKRNNNIQSENTQITEQETSISINSDISSVTTSLTKLINENNSLLTDYYWLLSDGRNYEDQSIQRYDWVGPRTPRIIFYKLDTPSSCVFYQERLRKDRFTIYYQTEGKDKLIPLINKFSNTIYDIIFENDYTEFSYWNNGKIHGRLLRNEHQTDLENPLVGIWGKLPNLNEYRIVDSKDCLYYMEIDKEIPFWAIRKGTYLLKQIDENTFETISSFIDGQLKLEVINNKEMILTPLFSLPDDEEGLVAPLKMHRSSALMTEDDNENYY